MVAILPLKNKSSTLQLLVIFGHNNQQQWGKKHKEMSLRRGVIPAVSPLYMRQA